MKPIFLFSRLTNKQTDSFKRILQLAGLTIYKLEDISDFNSRQGRLVFLLNSGSTDFNMSSNQIKKYTPKEIIILIERSSISSVPDFLQVQKVYALRDFPQGNVFYAALIALKYLSVTIHSTENPSNNETIDSSDIILLEKLFKNLCSIIEDHRYLTVSTLEVTSSINRFALLPDIDLFSSVRPIATVCPVDVFHGLWQNKAPSTRAHGYYLPKQFGLSSKVCNGNLITMMQCIKVGTSSHEAFHMLQLIDSVSVDDNINIAGIDRGIVGGILGRISMIEEPFIRHYCMYLERRLYGSEVKMQGGYDKLTGELFSRIDSLKDIRSETPSEESMDKVEVALGVLRHSSFIFHGEQLERAMQKCIDSEYWVLRWWALSNMMEMVRADSANSKIALSLGERVLFQGNYPQIHTLAIRELFSSLVNLEKQRAQDVLSRYVKKYNNTEEYAVPIGHARSILQPMRVSCQSSKRKRKEKSR